MSGLLSFFTAISEITNSVIHLIHLIRPKLMESRYFFHDSVTIIGTHCDTE